MAIVKFLALALLVAAVQGAYYKHLQGDPSEFSSFVLPTPEKTAESSTGMSLFSINLILKSETQMCILIIDQEV